MMWSIASPEKWSARVARAVGNSIDSSSASNFLSTSGTAISREREREKAIFKNNNKKIRERKHIKQCTK